MDIFLIILGIILMLLGLAGSVLPIPGPPLNFVGLLCLHFTDYANFNTNFLAFFGCLAIGITLLDFYTPAWGTKKFGGTKRGAWGAIIGLIIGIFTLGPLFILGAFLGALIGELLGNMEFEKALRAAFGSFVGFLVGIALKFIVSLMMTFHFFKALWNAF